MHRSTRNEHLVRFTLALGVLVFALAPAGFAGTFDGHPAADEADFALESAPVEPGDTWDEAPVDGTQPPAAPWDESPATETTTAADTPVTAAIDDELARFESGDATLDFPASLDPSETSEGLPGTPAMSPQGVRGHIHVVRSGDTLWDVSNLYLETPWTWPAIWTDNRVGIANPHRIFPGDRIWISPTEMRPITEDEAEEFIAAAAAAPLFDADDAASWTATPDGSLSVTGLSPEAQRRTLRVAGVNNVSFVSAEELEAATSIVESPAPRTFLSQGDIVYLGLGQGETQTGDRYTVFREAEEVRDFETGALYGYHIDVVGWVEVQSVGPETAVARIRMSKDTIERGDRMVPRESMPIEIDASPAPTDVDGRIIYMPGSRTQAAATDFVYLDRGSIHGLQIGHMLEVYKPGVAERDRVRGANVMTPDWNVGTLVVTSVQPDSAVAFVTHARRELFVGDAIRSVASGMTNTAMR